MESITERLLSLRVCDVMSPRSIHLLDDQTISEALELFANHRITGAPVVDETGKCVGVLSSSDFVRAKNGALASEGVEGAVESFGGSLVRDHMSPLPRTIGGDDLMTAAARLMCDYHVHRTVVLDDEQRPIGVVTALDVVAALINAVDES